jgi:hypothetical protein
LERLGVFGSVVGRQLHAEQQHARPAFLSLLDDAAEVLLHLRDRQAAQAVVRAQLHDEHGGLVLLQGLPDARSAAAAGIARDARVDDDIIGVLELQPLAEQRHPAARLGNAVGRRQTVT